MRGSRPRLQIPPKFPHIIISVQLCNYCLFHSLHLLYTVFKNGAVAYSKDLNNSPWTFSYSKGQSTACTPYQTTFYSFLLYKELINVQDRAKCQIKDVYQPLPVYSSPQSRAPILKTKYQVVHLQKPFEYILMRIIVPFEN